MGFEMIPDARRITTHTMTRLLIDLPATVPIIDLVELAVKNGCKIVRRPDGSLLFRPQP
jgi:hypothetical protein